MWGERDSVEAWPAVADMMTGTTLVAFVLGIGAVTLLPDGDENWDTLRQAGERYFIVRQQVIKEEGVELPPTVTDFVNTRLADDVRRSIELDSAQRELEEYRRMGAIRGDVARRIQEALARQGVEAKAENGRIQIKADVLFATGESRIDSDVPRKIGTALFEVLTDAQLAPNIRYVLVQGHTDARGVAGKNRQLSTDRARTIVEEWAATAPQFFRDRDDRDLDVHDSSCVGAKILFGGFGESRPLQGCLSEDCQPNRRLEIEIVPKRADEKDLVRCQ